MYYAISVFSTVLLAFEFSLNKKYQTLAGTSLRAGLRFNLLSGVVSALIILLMLGFRVQWTGFSAWIALGVTVTSLTYSLLSFRVLKLGGIAIYSTFLMSGGMLMPYVFGLLFLDEVLTLPRLLGMLVILAAVILTNLSRKKLNGQLILLCCLVFLLNGTVSILSKCHQISDLAVDSPSFVFYAGVFKSIFCALLLLLPRKETQAAPVAKKGLAALVVAGGSTIGTISYILQLTGAAALPASVLYPIITGGSILFSAIAGRVFFREKLAVRQIISIILCFIGTLLFL